MPLPIQSLINYKRAPNTSANRYIFAGPVASINNLVAGNQKPLHFVVKYRPRAAFNYTIFDILHYGVVNFLAAFFFNLGGKLFNRIAPILVIPDKRILLLALAVILAQHNFLVGNPIGKRAVYRRSANLVFPLGILAIKFLARHRVK